MLTTIWGPSQWHFLHTMSFNYPVKPTPEQKKLAKKSEDVNDTIYKAYIVFEGLKEKLLGDDDLSKYEEKSVDEIIEMEGLNFSSKTISKDLYIENYKNIPLNPDVLFVIEHPTEAVQYVKKLFLREKQSDILSDSGRDLIKIFLKVSKIQNVMGLNDKQLDNLVYKNYEKYEPLLPQIIQNGEVIKEFINSRYVPTEKEIDEAENFEFSDPIPLKVQMGAIEEIAPDNLTNVIEFYEPRDPKYGFLSPFYIYRLFKVGNELYPSVYHYLIVIWVSVFSLFNIDTLKLQGNNQYANFIEKSHNVIMRNNFSKFNINNYDLDITRVEKSVSMDFDQTFYNNLIYRLKNGLDYKFKRIFDLNQTLVDTGDSVIIYNDRKDKYLGGDSNLLGKTLMELREKFVATGMIQREIDFKQLKLNDFIKASKDSNKASIEKFKAWIYMRLGNVVFTLKTILKSLSGNENITKAINLTPELIIYLLEELYRPCKPIVLRYSEITNTPVEIYHKLKDDLKDYNIGPKGISVIWSYIYGLIDTAKNTFGGDSRNNINEVVDMLDAIPIYQEKKVQCEGKFKSDIKNCTLYAIKNILNVINKYIRDEYEVDKIKVSKKDFDLPISLITGGKPVNTISKKRYDTSLNVRQTLLDFFPELKELDVKDSNSIIGNLNKFLDDVANASESDKENIISKVNLYSDYKVKDLTVEEVLEIEEEKEKEDEEGLIFELPEEEVPEEERVMQQYADEEDDYQEFY
jgi:predicted NAD-dependent protein-ADP-ribosyltransferase YbiA (DUF1768 family)